MVDEEDEKLVLEHQLTLLPVWSLSMNIGRVMTLPKDIGGLGDIPSCAPT